MELNAQYNLIGTSRNCILIRDTIKYNRHTELEDTLNCDIWLQVALGNKKESLICGSYRQWSLFKEMGVTNSNSIKKQEERYKKSIEKWQKAIDEGREVIYLTDDNIDSNCDSDINKIYKIQTLVNILHDHMTSNNIVQHNLKILDSLDIKIQVVLIKFIQISP